MNLKELKELIELVSDKGFTEFEIERQGFRLRICRSDGAPQPAAPPAPSPIIISPTLPVVQELSSPAAQPDPAHAAPGTQAGTPPAAAPVAPLAASLPEVGLHTIKSPIVGTFYRSPSPQSDVFVKIGDHVEPDTVVCIIEAMKLMNEIQAEVSGEIVKTYVENGQPVEYGQPLFAVKT
jgi:acetyl-CoA carboxylase biotin carboxyl carrier protein